MIFRVEVPGKIMLAGEYGVLRGGPALSAAVMPSMHLSLEVSPSAKIEQICLESDLWYERRSFTWESLAQEIGTAVPYVNSVYLTFHHLKHFDLKFKVDSSLNPRYGLGSSSALRLGILALHKSFCTSNTQNKFKSPLPNSPSSSDEKSFLAFLAWKQQALMGIQASGYDFLTQSHGGLVMSYFHAPAPVDTIMAVSTVQNRDVNYDLDEVSQQEISRWLKGMEHYTAPQPINKLKNQGHVFVHPQGGSPTTSAIKKVLSKLTSGQMNSFFKQMTDLVRLTSDFLIDESNATFKPLADGCREHRRAFTDFGSVPEVFRRLHQLPNLDKNWTFKTTGAGGEDALLFWGDASVIDQIAGPVLSAHGWKKLTAPWVSDGVKCY